MSFTRDQVLTLATKVGMPWRYATDKDYIATYVSSDWSSRIGTRMTKLIRWSWTGKELIVTEDRPAENILHEICHWLEASKTRRRLPEFGLGSSPWEDVLGRDMHGIRPLVDLIDPQLYEIRTCWLQIAIVAAAGGDWRDTATDLNFDYPSDDKMKFWTWARYDAKIENHGSYTYPFNDQNPWFLASHVRKLAGWLRKPA